ncbi:hypothetical protein JCM17823_07930 [Halorubrum gandharaense]
MAGSPDPSFRTLRFLCGNAVAMVAFLLAYVAVGDYLLAIAAAVVVGAIGYAASSVVVDYARGG